jgi:hypothetical protein
LNQRKFGGDQILGREGMDSPRNPPRTEGKAQNRLGITIFAGRRSWEEGVQMKGQRSVKGFYTQGAGLV